MPAKMIRAAVGSSVYVNGSSNATVIAGPMPGSTPTAVPSVTPSSAYSRYSGCAAVAKPSSSMVMLSIEERHPFEDPGGQRQAQAVREHHLHEQCQHHRDRQCPPPGRAQSPGRAEEQQRGRDRPADQVDE